MQTQVRFHVFGPLAVSPPAVIALPREHRQQQLLFEEAVDFLGSRPAQTVEGDVERMRVILRADPSLMRPRVAAFVNPAKYQVRIKILRFPVSGMRAPEKNALGFKRSELF